MIVVAGGTGRLGSEVVRRLVHRGEVVRLLSRRPPERQTAEFHDHVSCDVRDGSRVARAVAGATTVISAVQGLTGRHGDNPRTVDRNGNANLIDASRAAGVSHFILVSVQGAAPDHRIELFRRKHAAEQHLAESGLPATVIRPTAFMQTWADLVVRPLLEEGRTVVFGRGDNPINFVSVHDVAAIVAQAAVDPARRGRTVDVGGPDNLSFNEVVDLAAELSGRTGTIRHVPRAATRATATLMRPFRPDLARKAAAGLVMDTVDMRFTDASRREVYPDVPMTSFRDFLTAEFRDAAG